MSTVARLLAVCALSFMLSDAAAQGRAAVDSAPASAAPASAPDAASAPAPPPALAVECVAVRDAGLFGPLIREDEPVPLRVVAGTATSNDRCKALGRSAGILTGVGDLLLAVDKTEYDRSRSYRNRQPAELTLFLNGVPLIRDARLVAMEEVNRLVILRYRILQGSESQQLWSILYADGGLLGLQPLHAALGWRSTATEAVTSIPVRSGARAIVRITDRASFIWAVLLVGFTVLTVIAVGLTSDTLREAATPEWLYKAKRLQRELARAGSDERRRSHLLRALPAYDPADAEKYRVLAAQALAGERIDPSDTDAAVVGLAERTDDWSLPRGTYSLSRTQVALWFTFTIATALFLWLVYGELRKIDESLLVLLGISVGTAGLSWAIDRGAGGRPYQRSRGFWPDLVTGVGDEHKQLHRYQAVIVNLLLLTIGIYHVAQQLTYPVFDSTWLIFLGVSGATYGAGKQILETGPRRGL